ncbi:globin [Paenibacillus sp. R14(2021)]|uniref:globin domain-containing protein n=1 Tax=Paenibacillus sp. R14(2021) TaxID=2859228 RepID=UPI001C612CDD|nr:globin [Paenibacillus sp. R14(2021)]
MSKAAHGQSGVFLPVCLRGPRALALIYGEIEEIKGKQKKFLTSCSAGCRCIRSRMASRMRKLHMDFIIHPRLAAAWLSCMERAMNTVGLTGEEREFLFDRLRNVAAVMVNAPDDTEAA